MMNLTLIVVGGKKAGLEMSVAGAVCRIGWGEECDVRLPRELVARRQCDIALEDGAATIEDGGNAEGTVINGAPVRGRQALNDGDLIHAGPLRLEVRLTPADREERERVEVEERAGGIDEAGPLEEDIIHWLEEGDWEQDRERRRTWKTVAEVEEEKAREEAAEREERKRPKKAGQGNEGGAKSRFGKWASLPGIGTGGGPAGGMSLGRLSAALPLRRRKKEKNEEQEETEKMEEKQERAKWDRTDYILTAAGAVGVIVLILAALPPAWLTQAASYLDVRNWSQLGWFIATLVLVVVLLGIQWWQKRKG